MRLDYHDHGATIVLGRGRWWRAPHKLQIDTQGVLLDGVRLPRDCTVWVDPRYLVIDSQQSHIVLRHGASSAQQDELRRLLRSGFERARERFGAGTDDIPDGLTSMRKR